MFKERGGKAQVAFRDALGLSESEDLEFQKTKVSAVMNHCTPRVASDDLSNSNTYEPSLSNTSSWVSNRKNRESIVKTAS